MVQLAFQGVACLRLWQQPDACATAKSVNCGARLKACAAYINEKRDVVGLCQGLPKRLAELVRRRGDRMCK